MMTPQEVPHQVPERGTLFAVEPHTGVVWFNGTPLSPVVTLQLEQFAKQLTRGSNPAYGHGLGVDAGVFWIRAQWAFSELLLKESRSPDAILLTAADLMKKDLDDEIQRIIVTQPWIHKPTVEAAP